jgi:hypothetical protein
MNKNDTVLDKIQINNNDKLDVVLALPLTKGGVRLWRRGI